MSGIGEEDLINVSKAFPERKLVEGPALNMKIGCVSSAVNSSVKALQVHTSADYL
jgi:hypothetical protein